jgi:hypothetical protein
MVIEKGVVYEAAEAIVVPVKEETASDVAPKTVGF